jgi:hypothetical protein
MYKGGAIVSTDNTEDFVFFPVTTYPDASPALVVVLLQPNGTEGPDVTLNSGQYMRVWTVNNVLSYQVYDWSNTNPPANANTIVNKAISDANAVGMVAPPLLGVSSSP